MVWDRENIVIANKYKVAHGLSIGIFTYDLGSLSKSRSCAIPLSISWKLWQIRQTLLLPTNRKSHVSCWLPVLNLILVNSKGLLGSCNGVLYDYVHCEQTAGSRNANLCSHMHVDKLRSPATSHPNRQRPWCSVSRSNNRMEYIGKCIMHSSLQAYRHDRGRYVADGRYKSPRFQGMSGEEVGYLSPRYVKRCYRIA